MQYTGSLLLFNTILFVYGYVVLALQPFTPLNPDGKTLLSPTTIFHSVASFMTNTDLQHYAGEVNLSNFSQIFFCIANLFLSAAIGLSALTAIIRAFRGDPLLGNFFVDMWRVVVYMFVPIAFVIALIFLQQGSPMTFETSYQVHTLEGGRQTIVVGPVAAFEAMKMLGTNGGGFYSMNSAHPFENPTGLSNFVNTLAMMIFPFALVLMYGRMLGRMGHSLVIFSVMLFLMAGTVIWSIAFDTLQPNPGLTAHPAREFEIQNGLLSDGKLKLSLPAVVGLPVDQHLGNLEGKELRFGTSAGSYFRGIDNRCDLRRSQRRSRQPQSPCSPFPHDRHVAELPFWWKRGGDDQHAVVCHHRHLYRRNDGRAYSGIFGQKNRRSRSEACDYCPSGSPLHDPDPYRPFRSHTLGDRRNQQSRSAWVFSNGLPIFIVVCQ